VRTSRSSSRGPGEAAIPGEASVQAILVPDERAPAEARELVRAFRARLDRDLLDAMRLLVSELVSNSVRHARLRRGDHVRVSVALRPTVVRLSVSDPGPGFPKGPAPDDPGREAGWGLHLVDRIADRWGVSGDGRSEVWIELDR
jgi:anti-sigma regulatory factor (Ser/Thr protein kinase)